MEQMQVKNLVDTANGVGIPVEFVSKTLLDKWAEGRPHQNLVLTAGPLPIRSINVLEDINGNDKLVLALDGLMDPQNIGAIIRSAYFLGATAVLLHGIDLKRSSQTVSRASAGVLEAWDQVYSTDKLGEFLRASKGPETISIAASLHQSGIRNLHLSDYGSIKQSNKMLVMGSEHDGVSKRVLAQCDYVTSIPSARQSALGAFNLDSLNVSAATAILLHQLANIKDKS